MANHKPEQLKGLLRYSASQGVTSGPGRCCRASGTAECWACTAPGVAAQLLSAARAPPGRPGRQRYIGLPLACRWQGRCGLQHATGLLSGGGRLQAALRRPRTPRMHHSTACQPGARCCALRRRAPTCTQRAASCAGCSASLECLVAWSRRRGCGVRPRGGSAADRGAQVRALGSPNPHHRLRLRWVGLAGGGR